MNILILLEEISAGMWQWVGVPLIFISGLYFAYKSRFMIVRKSRTIFSIFKRAFMSDNSHSTQKGISPLRAFFSSIAGYIGLENVVSICAAIQIGGPGALVWMWVTILLGMGLKYVEIYLGFVNRITLSQGEYSGGPFCYFNKVTALRSIPFLFALLMCVYGTDIYVFRVVTSTIVAQWGIPRLLTVILFLIAIIISGSSGFNRLGSITEVLIPFFTSVFIVLCFFIFIKNWHMFPAIISLIFKSAFSSQAAVGGMAGGGIWISMIEGMQKACYMGDFGTGFAAIIHAESTQQDPHKESIVGMMGIFCSAFFFCNISVLLILITGIWQEPLSERVLVMTALSRYIPYIEIVWPIFITLLGYSTLISCYTVNKKVMQTVFPSWGSRIHFMYAVVAFITFSFIAEERHLMTMISLAGLSLLIINMYAIIRLRKDISFAIEK